MYLLILPALIMARPGAIYSNEYSCWYWISSRKYLIFLKANNKHHCTNKLLKTKIIWIPQHQYCCSTQDQAWQADDGCINIERDAAPDHGGQAWQKEEFRHCINNANIITPVMCNNNAVTFMLLKVMEICKYGSDRQVQDPC